MSSRCGLSLPAEVADDPDRLRRFEQEARAAASLNHPNILSVHDVGNHSGVAYLVTELLKGRTLREEMSAGLKPTPYARLGKALDYAAQIADGLAAAHARGIVHRDLKPANIFVTTDGRVKILDFGLAKVVAAGLKSTSDVTETATASGIIVGTAGFMAPEQIRGQAVDARTDIFAFGCVLYELLAGRRAFSGETPSDTVSAILKDTPAPLVSESTDRTIPPQLIRIVERCLEKTPEARFQSTMDLAFALKTVQLQGEYAGRARVPSWRRAMPWAVAGVLGVAFVTALLMWSPWQSDFAREDSPRKVLAMIGADVSLAGPVSLSPDGTTLVFVGRRPEQDDRLFVRRLDQLEAVALAGTAGADNPFFSPDGRWIGFFAGGRLKKVEVSGGMPVDLCDSFFSYGGTWAADDTIVFAPTNPGGVALRRVSAAGGHSSVFGTFGEGARTQRWPQALPGGKGVLYTEHSALREFGAANLVVADMAGGPGKILVRGAFYGRYVPSGHLLYMQQATLVAVGFDLDRLEVVGSAVPVLEDIASHPNRGYARVEMAADGTVVYVPGGSATGAYCDRLDDPRWQDVGASRRHGGLGQSEIFSGRHAAGARNFRQRAT